MLPGSVAIVVLVLALVPGWLYLRFRERFVPRSATSALHELLEVVSAGLGTTGLAALFVALVLSGRVPSLVDVQRWADDGHPYLRQDVQAMLLTAAVVFVGALLLAIAFAYVTARLLATPARFAPGSVWVQALGHDSSHKVPPWVGVRMRDGRLIEGLLHSYTVTDTESDERDLALQRPIRVTPPGATEWSVVEGVDRVIIPARAVDHIAVKHHDGKSPKG